MAQIVAQAMFGADKVPDPKNWYVISLMKQRKKTLREILPDAERVIASTQGKNEIGRDVRELKRIYLSDIDL